MFKEFYKDTKKEGDLKDYTQALDEEQRYQLISHSALGLKDVLCIPAKANVSGKLWIFSLAVLDINESSS